MTVTDSTWTCPRCHRTVVVYASPDDTRACLVACQQRHATDHRKADRVLGRLPKVRDGA